MLDTNEYITGKEQWSNNKIPSQVYQATHDGAGNSLPYMSRAFISFTFGGKAIEDFGLIVVNSGDRMERQAYAEFNDLTSEYDVLNGQLYWGSSFSANKIELNLATDEITEQQLDSFREWFAPGKERELILSEHPNRAILARVESAPSLSLLPFEKQTSLVIGGYSYDTSTTIYKGEVTISFVMDDPHWYSKLNYMPSYINKKTLEKIDSIPQNNKNANLVNTLKDKDTLKIMIEDGIPHQSILIADIENLLSDENFFLGGNQLVTRKALISDVSDPNSSDQIHARVGQARLGLITEESEGLDVSEGINQYLFYSGTAPSYPTIQFSMLPRFDTNNYIFRPRNKIQNPSLTTFSTITIGDKVFKFTTPGILTGYNQALKIFSSSSGNTVDAVMLQIREKINEQYSRAWAIACLKILGISSQLTTTHINTLKTNMKKFIDTETPIIFSFNSKTGQATGKFSIKILNSTPTAEVINNTPFTIIEENVGDMICSDYLTIEGRNYLNSNGEIDIENCKRISSNENLTNVLVFFNNMYL